MRWSFGSALPGSRVVVIVEGTSATAPLLGLAEEVAQHTSAGTRIVLDLDGLVLTSSSALRAFVGRLDERGSSARVVLRCSRSTGRQLLRRWVGGSITVVSGNEGTSGS